MRRLRIAALAFTGLCPGPIKRALLRHVFGYRIGRRVRLGVVLLDCQALTIGDDARIQHGVVFTRCGSVTVGAHVRIGPLNLFRGGSRITIGDFVTILRLNVFNAIPDHECVGEPDSTLTLGRGTTITAEHRLDFTDRIALGRSVILAGRGTTIWTHKRRDSFSVTIGDHCYIGSEVRMAPGAAIPDCCIVGMGAVVIRRFDEPYSLIAGVPARRRRALKESDYETIFGSTTRVMPDDGYRPPAQVSPEPSPDHEVHD